MQRLVTSAFAAVLAAAGLVLVQASGAVAVDYPTRPPHIIVGYPAGGTTDILARLIGQKLGPALGTTIALGPINSMGRNVNSTIFIDDDFVSGTHAMLTFRGRSWFIEDQGSTNGTYVNGHRIDRPVALSFGDELTIGRVRMRLER